MKAGALKFAGVAVPDDDIGGLDSGLLQALADGRDELNVGGDPAPAKRIHLQAHSLARMNQPSPGINRGQRMLLAEESLHGAIQEAGEAPAPRSCSSRATTTLDLPAAAPDSAATGSTVARDPATPPVHRSAAPGRDALRKSLRLLRSVLICVLRRSLGSGSAISPQKGKTFDGCERAVMLRAGWPQSIATATRGTLQ